jgi:hypothetical protein
MRRFLLICCVGCNAAWGIEPADSVLGDGGVPNGDTGSNPCDPQAGVARACITFKLPLHPSYDITSGATPYRIDGAGTLRIDVFDEDPEMPGSSYATRVKLPLEGGELKVDSFPVTWPTTLSPGKHWFIAQFDDNKDASRNFSMVGDYVTNPGRLATGRFVWPELTATLDQTAKLDIELQPLRRVDADLQADATLRTLYKDYAVPGDGPITFGLFDGELSSTTLFLDLQTSDCFQAMPMSLNPPLLKTGFITTVTGTHKILTSLEDYDNKAAFPTSGSLITPDAPAASLTISPTSWTTSYSAKFVKVLNPVKIGERADPIKCP